jgi:aryl-alcohol dehydrogenase-like predicted oxidoreductase
MNRDNKMPTRHLRDLPVSALGLGCMGMSMGYGRPDKAEAQRTIDRAIELGVTLFDTADIYGSGENEKFIGECIGKRRDHVMIATKFGLLVHRATGMVRGNDGSPAHCRQSIDDSLKRLHMDYVDLYYLHRVDPKVPIEDSVGAMADLVLAGKVRHLGLSECSAETLRRAHAVHPITAVQMEWSIFTHDIEQSVLPTARELNVGVVPYSPLGRGILTGTAETSTKLSLFDFRRFLPRWQKKNLEANLVLVHRIKEIAVSLKATASQVALAWVLSQGEDVVPIPGTKRVAYLEENIQAAQVILPQVVIDELSQMRAAGARYPNNSLAKGETGMGAVNS